MLTISVQDAEHSHVPDYAVTLEGDQVVFRNRGTMQAKSQPQAALIFLKSETYDEARVAAPGWDVHYLESEWRSWMKERPKSPDRAFVGFCKKWFATRGRP